MFIDRAILQTAGLKLSEIKTYLVESTVTRLVEAALEIAPNAEDFISAAHVDGPSGDHALIVVEDELASILDTYPAIVAHIRTSPEWDAEVRIDDTSRAALALVSEAYRDAEDLWNEKMSARPTL